MHERSPGTIADPWIIGVSQNTVADPWHAQMKHEIETAAAEHDNLQVLFKDAEGKNSAQQAQIEDLLNEGIDLLIVCPRETGPLDKVVREVFRQGIPVVVLDRAVSVSDYSVYISANNLRIGKAAGEWARTQLLGKGTIVMLKGPMTSSIAQDRHRGFLQGLELDRNPGLTVGYECETDWTAASASKEMNLALVKLNDVDLVFAHSDLGAYAAFEAARDQDRHLGVKFVGIGALEDEGIEYVKEGVLDATFLYATGGPEAVDVAIRLLKNETVDKVITLATRAYDGESVDLGGSEVK